MVSQEAAPHEYLTIRRIPLQLLPEDRERDGRRWEEEEEVINGEVDG